MDDLLDSLRRFNAPTDGDTGGDVVNRSSLTSIAPEYASGLIFVGGSFRIRLSGRLASLGLRAGVIGPPCGCFWWRWVIGGDISPAAGDSGRA